MLHKKKTYKGIYALCDFETLLKRDIPLENFLKLTKKFDIKLIQYRDKISSIAEQKKNLAFLKANTDIPIIINDKLELLDFCDGLHLGQEDIIRVMSEELKIKSIELMFKLLRKKYSNKIIGISTHNEKEILFANTLPLDYIGLGAYRATSTKDVTNIIGEKASYLAKISHHEVGLIGGVKSDDRVENITYNVIGSGLL